MFLFEFIISVNLCTVMAIELIVFLYNEVIIQKGG